jgi:LPPG:FO 2-phospho-L-lactate transferase
MTTVALAGGVGAARFLSGLVRAIDPASITAVVNTGDDDEFHGLLVSPDLDTVTYTLCGAVNPDTGWGLTGDTFSAMDAMDRFARFAPDHATWFRLGDRDLATHLYRTQRRRAGASLTDVTAEICRAFAVPIRLLPMSDDAVPTRIEVSMASGPTVLRMQEWFVRERCEPPVLGVEFGDATNATAAPGVIDALQGADTIIISPSNPIISVGPILAVPGIADVLRARRDRVVAISPIIAGATVKGPADRLLGALGYDVSCVGVARVYHDVCGAMVIDDRDADRAAEIEAAGLRVTVAPTLMTDAAAAMGLALTTLAALPQ